MFRSFTLIAVGALTLMGCAKKPIAKEVSTTPITSAPVRRPNVNVSDELARACKLNMGNVDRAPRFDFDESALLENDRVILVKVAECVTSGPLKGRGIVLVGRADPRGESEYNMALGEHRADSVRMFLAHLGVAEEKMSETSRGELDAEGKDDATYARDRRVDIALQ